MNYALWTAVLIFLISYGLIISERVQRTIIALFGGMLMLMVGIMSQEEALEAIDFNTLALLVGMMIQVYILGKTGLFKWLSIWAAQKTKGNARMLLVMLSILVAICSMLLDNVTTVMLTVPVTFALARNLRVAPLPFVLAQIFSSNIGGTVTMIGDPPNIMIGSAVTELSFLDFVINLWLPCAISLVIVICLMLRIFRKELRPTGKINEHILNMNLAPLIRAPKLLKKSIFTLTLTVLLFSFRGSIPQWAVDNGAIAMGAASLLMISTVFDKDFFIEKLFSQIEWTTIFFFIGLFLLVGGLETTGAINAMASGAMSITGGDPGATTITILFMSAIMSAFVDNIPFVATMIPMIKDMGVMGYGDLEPLWWALSLGACLGGNGTIIGASANVVALAIARKNGLNISFVQYFKIAFPLTLITIFIAAIYLWIAFII